MPIHSRLLGCEFISKTFSPYIVFDFQKSFGLIALSGLKIALEEKLEKKVDIVEFASLDPALLSQIHNEVVMIYEPG